MSYITDLAVIFELLNMFKFFMFFPILMTIYLHLKQPAYSPGSDIVQYPPFAYICYWLYSVKASCILVNKYFIIRSA